MANRLKDEKSPYLLQHKENPVDWYPWGRDAFERAAKEEKPVFLSIGYSTCHWCHVMEHESFEDEEVADILNQNFISIKVDREERPDIDAVYMSVCQTLTGSGGWPLTILMTPDQKPFFAGTYFPKNQRYGRPGLVNLLRIIAEIWKSDRQRIVNSSEEITAAIQKESASEAQEPDFEILQDAFTQFWKSFDRKWGGFGAAPKFPTPHNLLFLMRYAAMKQAQSGQALEMVEKTLDAMARGGIHDQIGGGFSRYSTDEKWLVPHFEKMLYDNALLLLAYTKAYQITKKKNYQIVACKTADYLIRELKDESGGFICAQDADSEGVEGKYYVWTPEEVRSVLGETKGKTFCERYDITEEGNFEGKNIPNLIALRNEKEKDRPGYDGKYDDQAEQLFRYRLTRTTLHKDDKILLSWNAWTIIALASAGRILGVPRYTNAAEAANQFIQTNMVDQNNRLYVRFRKGEAAYSGQLEDYAVYALALLALYQTQFEVAYLEEALVRAEQMLHYFEDTEGGGYFKTASDAETLIARPKETYDGALPSGNSAAAMVLMKLAMLTGDKKWQDACDRQMRYLTGEAWAYPTGSSYALLAMADVLDTHKELLCAARDQVPEALTNYLKERPAYGCTILLKTKANQDRLAGCAPYTADYPLPEQGVLYYWCENGICRNPETSL